MKPRTFRSVAGAVFSLVALLHLLRLVFHWEAVIGGWTAPMWLSWLGLAVAGYLAYSAFTMERR